ncbi:hypothetical protein DEA8626_03099 [Defluviimonas aquaemixtae]|uniref:Uncharacterized protein n=1 Tax=Albidovulum aquaemixtae TaxID=1542388 RepID=A0A2R8BL45_9RHOB|nr:hypothetical protein [Defluviimonas aquaemixtae]SPH24051.1 hypothetical protein DEA8626_03099 [Defluviimonas aquaemixtae]
MDNPLTLWTNRAAGVLGALIRDWSLDPETRPEGHRMEGDRTCVIPIDAFRAALTGLTEGPDPDQNDYHLRDGIDDLELVFRRPDRVAFLMPEVEIMKEQSTIAAGDKIRVPALYADAGRTGSAPITHAVNDPGPATYDVRLGEDPLQTFLDPYLASYCCMQCK